MIQAKGVNGQVSFDGNVVEIKRSGLLARATVGGGEKRIPVKSITAVQWKNPGMGTRGFIQFTITGGKESKGRATDAAKDENSVLFTKKQADEFAELRAAVESAVWAT